MKITYDKKVDAMYIKLNEKEKYHSTKKVTENVMIDYSKDGQVLGVEVLNASENAVLPKKLDKVLIETL